MKIYLEIRTPLSGIIGSMGLLAETPLTNDQQEILQTAQVCGEQLLYIVNDILGIFFYYFLLIFLYFFKYFYYFF